MSPGSPAAPLPSPYEVPAPEDLAVAWLLVSLPGVTVWYGEATRHWWALLSTRGRRGHLIEADTLPGLAAAIARVQRYR